MKSLSGLIEGLNNMDNPLPTPEWPTQYVHAQWWCKDENGQVCLIRNYTIEITRTKE